MRLTVLLLALLLTRPALADPRAGGELYQQGRWHGAGLVGHIADGPPLPPRRLACAGCHGRDRGGGGEGGVAAPALTPAHLIRRGLDVAGLSTVLTSGTLPDGRQLNRAMPRFSLDDAAVADLLAYLRDPLPIDAPGVSPSEVRLGLLLPPAVGEVAPLLEGWAATHNREGGFWGRRLTLVRLPADPGALDAMLAATPVLALLAPLVDEAQAEVLRRHGVPELAPLAPSLDHDARIVALGPGLAAQAVALAQAVSRRQPALRTLPVLLPPGPDGAVVLAALQTVPGLAPTPSKPAELPADAAAVLVLADPLAAPLRLAPETVVAGPIDLLVPLATRPGAAGIFLLADPRAGLPTGGSALQRHLAGAIGLAEAILDRAGRGLTRLGLLPALAAAPIDLGGPVPFDYARFPDGGTASVALLEAEPAKKRLTMLPAPAPTTP